MAQQHGNQNSKPELQEVKSAIDVLYKGKDPKKKDIASKWLEEFQHSVHAWEIASQLLHMNTDMETSYFAAQTMRSKIQFSFCELPISIHNELKESLFQNLKNINKNSKATITQLCLALADLATQSPQWFDPVTDLVQMFSSTVDELPTLLEVLAYLPEEIESRHLKIGLNRRDEFLELLRRSSETVLQLLNHCLTNCPADEKIQIKIYHCFGSWLELGSFPAEDIAKSDLLKSVFISLLAPETSTALHDAVTDCICSALYIAEDISHQQALAESCFGFIVTLPQAYERSLKEQDVDRAINYARLFTEMAVSLLQHILNTPGQGPGSFETIEVLLLFLDHPDHEVLDITFRFWFRLCEYLYKDYPDEVLDVFRPYVQRLIMKLCQRCQLDLTQEGIPELSDDFQEFRFRAIEVVEDAVFIVGYTTCFIQVLKHMLEKDSQWNKIEAGMFVLQSIASKVSQRQEPYVGELVMLIINLQSNSHIALKHTAMRLLGQLTQCVDENKDSVDPVFQFVLHGLQDKQLANASASALEQFCVYCSEKLVPHFQVILQVVEVVDSLSLHSDEVHKILSGAAHVLSRLPYEQIPEGLTKLCIPQAKQISQILQAEPNSDSPPDPTTPIDRLATIFKQTAPRVPSGKRHPCQSVVEELWPMISNVADKFKHDERIAERTCRCLRFAIRCVGSGFKSLLQPFVEQMVSIYYQHHHSCFLYLGSILVDEYGSDPQCAQGLIEMLRAFSGPTFTLLSEQNGLKNRPDTVDDFFRLCIRLLQKCSVPFLENESMDPVMRLATAATVLNHREANASVMKFLSDLLRCVANDSPDKNKDRKKALVTTLIQEHGKAVVKGLVDAIAGGIQAYMVPDAAGVLWDLLSCFREHTQIWFKEALNSLPTHSPTGAIYATSEQIASFYESVTGATTIQHAWRAARGFCRLFQ